MIILALDLSTISTGYAAINQRGELIMTGLIVPTNKAKPRESRKRKLARFKEIAAEVLNTIDRTCATKIYIEEVNQSPNRIAQKTLAGLHWIVLDTLGNRIDAVEYIDTGGATGWRTHLGLKLTDKDKKANKVNKGSITAKHLAARYANKKFNLKLNVDERKTDSDIADAVCIAQVAYMRSTLKI